MMVLRSFLKKLLNKKRLDFLDYLGEFKGYSDLTLKSYGESIYEALNFVELLKEDATIIINLMPYRLEMTQLNPKTISKKLSAMRTFCEYLNDNGIKTVLKSDSSVKVASTLPKPISHKHISQALECANIYEKLLVTMLYTLGLRISELQSLKISDISDGWIRVNGKGNKDRDIPLLASSKDLIDRYLSEFHPKTFLFESNDKKLSQNTLRYTINKVFKRVGIKVTPHQLRHSYATALLNGGAPIADVSELLGHSSMATTQIYTKLGSALKQQNYNKAHPLCGDEKC
jgi:integrase/recombinase XerC